MENQQNPLVAPINNLKKLYNLSYLETVTCSDVCSLIFNFITWLFFILIIITSEEKLGYKNEKKQALILLFIILFSFSYLVYLITEFHSTTFTYLKAKNNKTIKEKIGDIFKKKPSVCLYIECYHYNNDDNAVITYKNKSNYTYYFFRDISGIIKLNINEFNSKFKYYAILKVIQEVIFIDHQILFDYNNYKEQFIQLNKNKDVLYNFSEFIEIEGIKNINLIKLGEKEAPFISYGWLKIFTILSLASLYKLYICLMSINQTITVRKIISNINGLINDPIYNRYNPQFKFLDKIITYNNAQGELPLNYDISNENIVGYNNVRREFPLNDHINNENLNRNDINIQIKKKDSISTKYSSKVSEQEE